MEDAAKLSRASTETCCFGELCLSQWSRRRVGLTRTLATKDCRHEGAAKTAVSRRLADPFSTRTEACADRTEALRGWRNVTAVGRRTFSNLGSTSKERRGLRQCQVDNCARQREDENSGQPPSRPPPRAIASRCPACSSTWPSAHFLQGGGRGREKRGTPLTRRQRFNVVSDTWTQRQS